MTNELMNQEQTTQVNQVTGEVIVREQIIEENERYALVIQTDGKPKRKLKFQKLWSVIPETPEQVEELFKVTNDSKNEIVKAMKLHDGKEIAIKEILFTPYEKFNEDTFGIDYGVTTTLQSIEGDWYATSSKVAYYQLQNMIDTFGMPNEERYVPMKVRIYLKKESLGYSTNLEFLGLKRK